MVEVVLPLARDKGLVVDKLDIGAVHLLSIHKVEQSIGDPATNTLVQSHLRVLPLGEHKSDVVSLKLLNDTTQGLLEILIELTCAEEVVLGEAVVELADVFGIHLLKPLLET